MLARSMASVNMSCVLNGDDGTKIYIHDILVSLLG